MGYIKVNQEKVTEEIAKELQKLCPFNAFDYFDGKLSINAGCKICKICVNKGPIGVCEFIEGKKQEKIDKTRYKGITVLIQQRNSIAHKVSWELIGKALELAKKTKEPVYALAIGDDLSKIIQEAREYGVDKVFVYEDLLLKDFNVERYTTVIEDFFKKHQVNAILFGGTPEGRSLAPRVAARLKTGLTADCTMLDIRPDGDLLQIRPAFGGNIMAKIHTPNTRPQMATIRYKMFSAPKKVKAFGLTIYESIDKLKMDSRIIVKSYNLNNKDVVIGIAASGVTPFAIGGLEYANKIGAETACITTSHDSQIAKIAKHPIEAITGAEPLTGSTRMKSGTAQKLILNMITTASMIKLGKVYENLMVDVQMNNNKLISRARGIIMEVTGVSEDVAKEYLDKYKSVKYAIFAILSKIEDRDKIEEILNEYHGNIREGLKNI